MPTVKPAPAPAPGPAPAGDEFEAIAAAGATVEGIAAPGGDGNPSPAPGGDGSPSPVDRDAFELLAQLKIARTLARSRFAWWPEFGQVWSDETLGAIAHSLAQVMALHGLSIGQVMGRFGPYIALAFAVGTPSFVTWEAIRERRELEARAERARRTAPPPPAAEPGGAGGP